MKQHIFGNRYRTDRSADFSPEINHAVDDMLWDAANPTKDAIHFGYDPKTAMGIIVHEYFSAAAEGDEPRKPADRTIAELALREAGFTDSEISEELSRVRLNIFAGLVKDHYVVLHLVS